ncbi:MAG: UDP-N-acetylmuramate--L-alanine ligase [Clostridiales bacterium]|nr:UDP-N-acetylmuramate--L-alanine ligase [Clostridiales bacterium]
MVVNRLWKSKNVYFIGIGGISMSGLAEYLLRRGCRVFGSDIKDSEQVEKLLALGVDVAVGERVDLLRVESADIVVYTDAIPIDNKELSAAFRLGKTVLSRAELLAKICADFSRVVAVAGSHGKTTCTAMCAHVLKEASAPFCSHIGGVDLDVGSFFYAGNEYFLTEACEYKKNLLKIYADTAILLNVDKDHLECYDGESDLKNTFLEYCANAKTAVVCLDDPIACLAKNAVTFSIYEKGADYRATYLRQERQKYSFSVLEYGVKVCRIRLKTVGRYNVYNALAAFAAMRTFGFSVDEIKRGLESFVGVKRRFEEMGRYRGAEMICDYAHHPKEIFSVVETARKITRGRLFVVFQPHTYSRTRNLMGEFVDVLRSLGNLVIYKTFPARECYDEKGDGKYLAECVGNCLYADTPTALRAWMDSTVSDGDTLLFLGAGDIYYLAKHLLKSQKT